MLFSFRVKPSGLPLYNRISTYLLWFYFVTVSESSCLGKLAKPYAVAT